MGSALYMSPEQMQQARGVDHRTDIYALGISLYELLAGKQPFHADTLPALCAEIFTGTPTPIRVLRPDISEGLATVLEKAYARDRGARYQSVGELALALAPWAPPQSQSVLESVARIAGLPAPTAGAAAPASLSSSGGASSGTSVSLSGGAPAPPGAASGRVSSASVLGGLPATTGAGVSVGSEPAKPSSKGAVVAVALCVLALAGGGAYFFGLRGAKPSTSAASSAASAPGPTAVAAPEGPGSHAPAPSRHGRGGRDRERPHAAGRRSRHGRAVGHRRGPRARRGEASSCGCVAQVQAPVPGCAGQAPGQTRSPRRRRRLLTLQLRWGRKRPQTPGPPSGPSPLRDQPCAIAASPLCSSCRRQSSPRSPSPRSPTPTRPPHAS